MAKPTKSFWMPSLNVAKLDLTKAETGLNTVGLLSPLFVDREQFDLSSANQDDKLTTLTDKFAQASAIMAKGQEVYKTLNIDIMVVDNILEGAKQLMVVLDGVAEVHPAVKVAVMAFKVSLPKPVPSWPKGKKSIRLSILTSWWLTIF
jgi:hypothetical protein